MAMMTDGVIHWKISMAMMMEKVTIMVTTVEYNSDGDSNGKGHGDGNGDSTIVIAINQAIAKYIAIANAMGVTINLWHGETNDVNHPFNLAIAIAIVYLAF